jgi:hypothetical protein
LTACPASKQPYTPQQFLKDAARGVETVSIACEGAYKAVLIAMPENTPERVQILNVIATVTKADTHARSVLLTLDGKNYTSVQGAADIVVPLLSEFRKMIDDGLAGFKSAQSKIRAQEYLDGIIIAVNTLKSALELKGVKI